MRLLPVVVSGIAEHVVALGLLAADAAILVVAHAALRAVEGDGLKAVEVVVFEAFGHAMQVVGSGG